MGFKEILNERIEAEGEDYEIVSGKSRIRMVTFIKLDGSMHCANYAFLHGVVGGEGNVRLDFARYMVVIKGRNLGGVQKALADHRLTFVKESDPSRLFPSKSIRVDQIHILHGRKETGGGGSSSAATAGLPVSEGWRDLSGKKRLQRAISARDGFSHFRLLGRGAASESALKGAQRQHSDREAPSVGRASPNVHPARS
jgi:hypothetical protein